MKGKISAVFLISSISISSTKSAIFVNFASPSIVFANCVKMAFFYTFENSVILLAINVLKVISSMKYIWNDSIKTI